MILGSIKSLSIGSIENSLFLENEDGTIQEIIHQPFCIIREATEQEFEDYWKNNTLNGQEWDSNWRNNPYGKRVIKFYEISMD